MNIYFSVDFVLSYTSGNQIYEPHLIQNYTGYIVKYYQVIYSNISIIMKVMI